MLWILIAAVAAAITGIAVVIYKGAKRGTVRFAKHSSAWWKSYFASFMITSYFLGKKDGKKKK